MCGDAGGVSRRDVRVWGVGRGCRDCHFWQRDSFASEGARVSEPRPFCDDRNCDAERYASVSPTLPPHDIMAEEQVDESDTYLAQLGGAVSNVVSPLWSFFWSAPESVDAVLLSEDEMKRREEALIEEQFALGTRLVKVRRHSAAVSERERALHGQAEALKVDAQNLAEWAAAKESEHEAKAASSHSVAQNVFAPRFPSERKSPEGGHHVCATAPPKTPRTPKTLSKAREN